MAATLSMRRRAGLRYQPAWRRRRPWEAGDFTLRVLSALPDTWRPVRRQGVPEETRNGRYSSSCLTERQPLDAAPGTSPAVSPKGLGET